MIDRVPEELWVQVCYIIHEAVVKTIPMKKKCKKAKWLSEEALQIAEKGREVRSKGEKERYTHLNAEFQRIQGEIRKPLSVINAKKYRKTTDEWVKEVWCIYINRRILVSHERRKAKEKRKDISI